MQDLFAQDKFHCPLCGNYYPESKYLKEAFESERERWLANMVTHYRHHHIVGWNNCWGDNGHRYRRGWFGDYDEEKRKVNERAKRQIIRKCREYMLFHEIGIESVYRLRGIESMTIKLAEKLLNKAA